MAMFEYTAVTRDGRAMTGTLEAESHQLAEQALAEMQLTVNAVSKTERPRLSAGGPERRFN